MLKSICSFAFVSLFFLAGCTKSAFPDKNKKTAGNPIAEGWYADPEGVVFGKEFWVYPTTSDAFPKQMHFDAFSSKDLVNWTKHERVLDSSAIDWATQAMWAPSVVENNGKYYFFFGANDVQRPERGAGWDPNNPINHYGGIGIAVADSPAGPFKDYLGKPLIDDFYNDAQPIDQFVFKDTNGQWYIFYGGWSHCNLGKLSNDFKEIIPWENGEKFKEITPKSYVEGPTMFIRKGKYYFLWSEGGWTNDTYKVAYAITDNVAGPFERVGTFLDSEKDVATGAGHNSVINVPGTDDWYIVYHRRPIPNKGRDHRVTCIDRMYFNEDGTIQKVKMTFEGVSKNKMK